MILVSAAEIRWNDGHAPTRPLLAPALLAGPLMAAGFFGLSVLFWRHATRAYSSASS